jgi:hypothetical protein
MLAAQDGEFVMRLIHLTIWAGLCVSAWAGTKLDVDGVLRPEPSSTVERATKGDRTLRPFNVGMATVSVEIQGPSDSAVTVRDRDGSLLYQLDPANRTTIVAKAKARTRAIPATLQPTIPLPLPDGCESAFSPYAAPDRAHVIGRCIS